ncbi:MAG TPA: hypothetical protein VF835_02045, partial [Rhizomicrobium sp.]
MVKKTGKSMRKSLVAQLAAALLVAGSAVITAASGARAQVNVTTYHYDNLRTGWNQNETTLSQSSFTNFGLLQ